MLEIKEGQNLDHEKNTNKKKSFKVKHSNL